MFGNVLVALRDPSMAHPALEEAVDLAAGEGARLTVLFVVGEVAAGWFDIASEGGDRDPERLASVRLAAERLVAEALARLPWVPEVRTELVEGPFGLAVAEHIGLGDFDAAVIEAGGRGRGGG